ncbi:MAG: hydrogen gas-evolving membrane-bound hydrogenase subunit E [Rubrobacteraceae bacterium]
MAGVSFAAVLWGWAFVGGGSVNYPWAPTWNLRLAFELDGLAALYAMLATGIGLAVVAYSSKYLPLHLEHQGRPDKDIPRFHAFILMFMGSMVGLVMAQDLLLIFVFWDLTAIASYFLIAYDMHEEESRRSALMAMLVTGITAVLLLIGAMMLYVEYGTFFLPELIEAVEPGVYLTSAAAFMAIAGLAKSAQVPFHFWLPRAMAAPTPVSAYLHSAAMVAAGVFLLGRVYPLIKMSDFLLDALLLIGFVSMLTGGILALSRDTLKQLLAYSTISQYGYIVFMFGLGGPYGAAAASFYVIAHALSKSALFLSAGAVTESSGGETRLSRLGGMLHRQPLLAVSSGLAAAGLAAFPFTIGFFKDEVFFEAALQRGWPFPLLALFGTILTLAYMWRFWSGVFLGEERGEARLLPAAMTAPIAILGLLTLLGGIFVSPFASLAEAAGSVTFDGETPISPAYHLDLRPVNLLALATFGLGAVFILSRSVWGGVARALSRFGEIFGPQRWYDLSLSGLNNFSDRIHWLEVDTLRSRVAAILIPLGILVGGALLVATPTEVEIYSVGRIGSSDVPLAIALLLMAVAAVAATIPRNHLTLVLVLSGSGFSLAAVYAFFGGPDVALVAVLVETIMTLLLLGVIALMPPAVLKLSEAHSSTPGRKKRAYVLGAASGVVAFIGVWGTLSRPSPDQSVATRHIELAPDAHAGDIVTAILADFRGLDTLGEITVIGIALLGISALLLRGRLW